MRGACRQACCPPHASAAQGGALLPSVTSARLTRARIPAVMIGNTPAGATSSRRAERGLGSHTQRAIACSPHPPRITPRTGSRAQRRRRTCRSSLGAVPQFDHASAAGRTRARRTAEQIGRPCRATKPTWQACHGQQRRHRSPANRRSGRLIHGRAGQPGRAGTGCSARRGFERHGCCPRRPLVQVIGCARPLLVWWVQEVPDDGELPPATLCGITGLVGLAFLCVQEGEANIQHRYCGGRFSRTRGFSVAMRSPSATLSSGSSQKNVRIQLL
jgi:hypothetical protein